MIGRKGEQGRRKGRGKGREGKKRLVEVVTDEQWHAVGIKVD